MVVLCYSTKPGHGFSTHTRACAGMVQVSQALCDTVNPSALGGGVQGERWLGNTHSTAHKSHLGARPSHTCDSAKLSRDLAACPSNHHSDLRLLGFTVGSTIDRLNYLGTNQSRRARGLGMLSSACHGAEYHGVYFSSPDAGDAAAASSRCGLHFGRGFNASNHTCPIPIAWEMILPTPIAGPSRGAMSLTSRGLNMVRL